MAEQHFDPDVDRYVLNQLDPEEEAAFEARLLEDAGLQAEVEAALGIVTAVRLGGEESRAAARGNPWTSYALAASIALAVLSTVMYWHASVESGDLQNRLDALRSPQANVLTVPVDIMRSADKSTPDAIIQKPTGNGAVVLDIELPARFQQSNSIDFTLRDAAGASVLAWSSAPDARGRARVLLQGGTVPEGRVELEMSANDGQLTDSRLIEFRPAPN